MSTIERTTSIQSPGDEPRWTVPFERGGPALPSALPSVSAPASVRPLIAEAPAFAFDVAIVGLGYVGLPTALAYFASGARVLALEASPARVSTITSRTADLLDRDRLRLVEALGDDRFQISTDPELLQSAAAVIVCVPTPVDAHLVPDLTALRGACRTVVDNVRHGQLVMLTSTSYVGCTDDLVVKPLIERGFTIGRDVFVAFSAERIDPGNAAVDQEDVPRVMGAVTEECEEEAERLLHRYAASVHRVRSLAAAEMTKLVENTFRAVNIALVNEFADICTALDISVTDVISAAATKPYGFMAFTPGPGVGGHCIPCDPHYLLWQLKRLRVDAPMITQAMTEISARPSRVVDRIRDVLSSAGFGMTGARVLVVGVTYKPDVDDLRESPALEILSGLAAAGAEIAYVDPHVPRLTLDGGRILESVTEPATFGATLVLVHTRHSGETLDWTGGGALVIDASYSGSDVIEGIAL